MGRSASSGGAGGASGTSGRGGALAGVAPPDRGPVRAFLGDAENASPAERLVVANRIQAELDRRLRIYLKGSEISDRSANALVARLRRGTEPVQRERAAAQQRLADIKREQRALYANNPRGNAQREAGRQYAALKREQEQLESKWRGLRLPL